VRRKGERGYRLEFGHNSSLSRTVVAIWDTARKLRSYSDTRGDMRGPPTTPMAQRGPQTSIMIDFNPLRVLAVNHDRGTDRGLLLDPVLALNSEYLGSPLAMLERLHRQCGAPYRPDERVR